LLLLTHMTFSVLNSARMSVRPVMFDISPCASSPPQRTTVPSFRSEAAQSIPPPRSEHGGDIGCAIKDGDAFVVRVTR